MNNTVGKTERDSEYDLERRGALIAAYDAGFNAGEAATRKQIAPAGVADYERLLASGHAGLAGTIATQLAKHLDIAADLIAAAVLTAGWTTGKDSTTEYVGKDATATVAELRAEVSNGHTFAPAPAPATDQLRASLAELVAWHGLSNQQREAFERGRAEQGAGGYLAAVLADALVALRQ